MDKLLLTGVSQPWTYELMPGINTLGRNPTNDFRIPDGSVSSFHCEIIVSDNDAIVRDLGSTNGTFINGKQIQENVLRPGEILQVGSAELRLSAEATIAIPAVSLPPQLPVQTVLPDGSPACLNHPGVPAAFRCTKCEQMFCIECTRVLRRAGGATMCFCPSCTGQCVPVADKIETRKPAKSLFGRLTQTLKLPFRKNS